STPPPWLPDLDACIDAEWLRRDPDHTFGPPVIGNGLATSTTPYGNVLVWDLSISREPIREIGFGQSANYPFSGNARDIAIHPDGYRIAIATSCVDAPVQLWDARSGTILLICEGFEGWANAVAFSPDGKWLAAGSDDRTVRVWRVPD